MRRDRGHTLVELVVALAVVGIAMAGLVFLRFGSTITGGISGGVDAREARALEQRLRRMVLEVQEGTRLIHPPAGQPGPAGRGYDGLAFIDPRGEVILYYLEDNRTRGSAADLVRLNVNARRRGERDAREVVVENVTRFAAHTAPAAPGKCPSLVTCEVTVLFPGEPAPRSVDHVVAIFLRNLEMPNPDDVFPDGTPLR